MYITGLSEINIIVYPCFPAPLQLLSHGLFICAPVTPSLVVDLRVLKFVCLFFIHQSRSILHSAMQWRCLWME
ncbi:hypothetical protein BDR06DRAFT_899921 [Suillus hirtellus]|nr:hypothetical protein BDR06DRAFT_899921 [Suillus hirtellus]